MNAHRGISRARGFSLVELMIALVLGLFLVAGVAQVYLGSKRSFTTQEGVSRLQENGRIGMLFLQRTLRVAGYYRDPRLNPATLFTDTTPAIQGTEGRDGAPDTITVRFQAAEGTRNCLGDVIAPGVTATNSFSLTAPDAVTGLRSLQCNTGTTTQPLLEGISDLQFLYGVDTTPADLSNAPNQYLDAAGVGGNWASVRSVRLTLTANSVTPLDGGALRSQAFVATIALRNRL